jgi:hypothetical protein
MTLSQSQYMPQNYGARSNHHPIESIQALARRTSSLRMGYLSSEEGYVLLMKKIKSFTLINAHVYTWG